MNVYKCICWFFYYKKKPDTIKTKVKSDGVDVV